MEIEHVGAVPFDWHATSADDVCKRLQSSKMGLSEEQARERLAIVGLNTIPESDGETRLAVLVSQFRSPLIYILSVAAILSAVVGEFIDAGTITAIILLNGIIGFIQEWRAAEAIKALRQMMSPTARIRRDGREREIDAEDLVPGTFASSKLGTGFRQICGSSHLRIS